MDEFKFQMNSKFDYLATANASHVNSDRNYISGR